MSSQCGIISFYPLPVASAEDADFAGGVTSNSVKVSMEVPAVMVPLPLEHDNVIEGDEMFLCFVTANRGTRISAGRIKLTVLDDDISEWSLPKS